MNGVNKTLYIPLYGKSYVSKKGIIHIDELKGFEKKIFAKLYAGNFSKKLYRLYEYKKKDKLGQIEEINENLEVFIVDFELLPMMECEIPMFKRDIQEAFQKGFEEVYGKT